LNASLQEVTYSQLKDAVLDPHCVRCHSDINTPEGLGKWVKDGDPDNSPLFTSIQNGDMPKGKAPLSTLDLEITRNYIIQLAPSSGTNPAPTPTLPPSNVVTFAEIKTLILEPYRCLNCHSLGTESKITKWINTATPNKSLLYTAIRSGSMPVGNPKVPSDKQEKLLQYLEDFSSSH
jgi:hypothetical protein